MSTICFSSNIVSLAFISVVAGIIFMHIYQRQELQAAHANVKTEYVTKTEYVPLPSPSNPSTPFGLPTRIILDNGVDTRTGPEKPFVSEYDTRSYYEVGYAQNTEKLLSRMKLYARRKFPGSERFDYYVLDDNGIKIVVTTPNNKELYENDMVSIAGFPNNTFVAHLYETSGPRYQAYV